MRWAPRLKPAAVRKLYHLQNRGGDAEQSMLDVGWSLFALCESVIVAVTALRLGEVPCAECSTPIQRDGTTPPTDLDKRALLESTPKEGWFACPSCNERILWRDCRDALRQEPRCFTCHKVLRASGDALHCECGKQWDAKRYRTSVKGRRFLPCPKCHDRIRQPVFEPQDIPPRPTANPQYKCTKCGAEATRADGKIQCGSCGHSLKWTSYKNNLKRRDEALSCGQCGHSFRWREWRADAYPYVTGNPRPAVEFLKEWPKSKTPETQMMQIDRLVQALHGQGPLAPVFIEGTKESVRKLLDELAALP